MPKFNVTGADRETGEDIELTVEAATLDEARARANRRGILVANCAPARSALNPAAPAKRSTRDVTATLPKPGVRPAAHWRNVIILIVFLLAAGTGVFYWLRYDAREREYATRTFKEAAEHSPSGAEVRQAWDAAAKKSQEHATEAERSVQVPPSTRVVELQGGTVRGEVWVQTDSREVVAIAAEPVLLLPQKLSLTGDEADLKDGLTALKNRIEVGERLRDNQSAQETARSARRLLGMIEPQLRTGSISTKSLIVVSAALLDSDSTMGMQRTATALGKSHPAGTDMVRRAVDGESLWKVVQSQATATAMTGRDGKYQFADVPFGKYTVACRTLLPTFRAVVYWHQAIEVTGAADMAVDLAPQTAVIISY